MRLALTLARRSLLQRPGRTLFSVLGVGVGIATVVGVFTLDHNTVEGLKVRYEPEWRPEVIVHEDGERTREELLGLEGVGTVAAYAQQLVVARPASVKTPAGAEPAAGPEPLAGSERAERLTVHLLAAETDAVRRMEGYRLAAGEHVDPRATRPQALVGSGVVEKLGVAPGDVLLLSPPPRAARRACIDGELRVVEPAERVAPPETAFEVVGVLTREKLGRRAGGDFVLVEHGPGAAVLAGVKTDAGWWVRRDPAVDVERLQGELSRSFAFDLGRGAVIGEAADERAFRNGVRMAGLLALVLGLYVVFHTLSMSLVERLQEVATLHALGTSRTQIARVFLTEAALLAGLGGVVGLAGGVGLAAYLLSRGITTLGAGRTIELFEVPWSVAVPLAAAGVGVALLGSVFPLLRARSADSVAALRGEQALAESATARGFHLFAALLLAVLLPALYFVIVPVVGAASGMLVGSILIGVGVLALLVIVPLLVPSVIAGVCVVLTRPFERRWPFAGAMAARSMRDSRRRVAVSTAAIALVVAAFVGLKGMTNSLRGEVEQWADAAIRDKVFALDLPALPRERLVADLARYPGVVGVEGGSARHVAGFLLLGVHLDDLAAYGPLAADPELVAAMREGHGMILSERVARSFGHAVGDAVAVRIGGDRVQEFRVVAISDAYGYFPHPDERMYGVVADRYMHRYFCQDVETVDRVAVRLAPGTDPDVVAGAIEAHLAGLGDDGGDAAAAALARARLFTGAELRRVQLADIDRDFLIFDVILGLTALLAALGVLNGQLLAALERSKELGVLKALGASRAQIAGMVLLESVVVGVLGGVLGLALGSGLGPVIVRALESLSGLVLPDRTAQEWLWLSLAGAVAVAVLAGAYPIWRMNRMDAVRAVRTG